MLGLGLSDEVAEPCDHPPENLALTHVQLWCNQCGEELHPNILDLYVEHERIVKTGIAILTGELEQHRKELEEANGELMVPIPPMDSDDPRDATIRKLMRANSAMRRQRDERSTSLRKMEDLAAVVAEAARDLALAARTDLCPQEDLVRKAEAVLQVLRR